MIVLSKAGNQVGLGQSSRTQPVLFPSGKARSYQIHDVVTRDGRDLRDAAMGDCIVIFVEGNVADCHRLPLPRPDPPRGS